MSKLDELKARAEAVGWEIRKGERLWISNLLEAGECHVIKGGPHMRTIAFIHIGDEQRIEDLIAAEEARQRCHHCKGRKQIPGIQDTSVMRDCPDCGGTGKRGDIVGQVD